MPGLKPKTQLSWRRLFHDLLEDGSVSSRGARFINRAFVSLLCINLAAIVAGTMPLIAAQAALALNAIEWVSLVVFTAEYALRVWIAPSHALHSHLSVRMARLNYITSGMGLIDLVAVAPFWFAFLLPDGLRVILVLRVVRFLKLMRYLPAMRSLLDALYRERRALFGCLVILAGAALFSATAMYLVERHVQPDKFGTIPDSLWWAISTLGTIGYGDVVPVTPAGRLVASLTVIAGLVMIALPVGIVAKAFSDEIHRRDFVITWSMIARVPVFSELSAGQIADVMELLRARTVEADHIITRKGEPADAMYFIAAGTVEIQLAKERIRLGAGHFFGEISALRRTRRSATARAVTRVSLLVLEAPDLHALMAREPEIARRIHEVMRSRLGRLMAQAEGDVLPAEIAARNRKPS